MHHILRRGGVEHRVDNDVWLCALDLAAVQGWAPVAQEQCAYARPRGLEVSEEDARAIANCLTAELAGVSDTEVPLTDQAFGEEHTEALLSRRLDGKRVSERDVLAAREILSGSPKRDAEQLAMFMQGGAFSVDER